MLLRMNKSIYEKDIVMLGGSDSEWYIENYHV